MTFNCLKCGKSGRIKPSAVLRGRGRYCSLACAASVACRNRDQRGSKNPKWRGGVPSVARKRRYVARHPERHLAHRLMTNAIRRGELIRMPCEDCGAIKVEGHHEDYTQPLIVKWLCKRHHLAAHKQDVKFLPPHESSGEWKWMPS